MTTKTRRPLAAKKPLPMLHFPANQESSRRRVMLAAADAREAVQRSLKIECLEAANFRAHVSAAPLKHELHRASAWRVMLTFPRSRERGPIEAL